MLSLPPSVVRRFRNVELECLKLTAVQTPIATPVHPLSRADRSGPRLAPVSAPAAAGGAAGEPKRTGAFVPSPADVALTDWSALMSAVKGRLERLAGAPHTDDQPSPEALAGMAEGVRQCVAALDQLQATLVHELARRPRLELEVFDLQTGLQQARAELAGTRAGEKLARHQAMHDGLTGLPNRRHFRDRLDLALGQPLTKPSPLAVFFLDLDDFKQINDFHGHAVGDDLLRIVATRLARALRAEDMVCRWGGDEFAGLLLTALDRTSLGHLAEKLCHAVSAPMQIGALKLRIRPSIGLAMAPADGISAGALMQHADAAMYCAKRNGGGHAFHQPTPSPAAGPAGA